MHVSPIIRSFGGFEIWLGHCKSQGSIRNTDVTLLCVSPIVRVGLHAGNDGVGEREGAVMNAFSQQL